jgi:hypothetical protein
MFQAVLGVIRANKPLDIVGILRPPLPPHIFPLFFTFLLHPQSHLEIVRVRRLISDLSAQPALTMTPRLHDPSIATAGVLPDLVPEQMRALLQVGLLALPDTAML